jgi:hypothetical protein
MAVMQQASITQTNLIVSRKYRAGQTSDKVNEMDPLKERAKKKSTDTRPFLHSLNPADRSAELQSETDNKIKTNNLCICTSC